MSIDENGGLLETWTEPTYLRFVQHLVSSRLSNIALLKGRVEEFEGKGLLERLLKNVLVLESSSWRPELRANSQRCHLNIRRRSYRACSFRHCLFSRNRICCCKHVFGRDHSRRRVLIRQAFNVVINIAFGLDLA